MADGGRVRVCRCMDGRKAGHALVETVIGRTRASGEHWPNQPGLPSFQPPSTHSSDCKSQGLFDSFHQDCLASMDTKSACQNLRQKVDNFVLTHLNKQECNSTMNKN